MNKVFTNGLKMYRLKHGEMSQEELGRVIGLSRSSVSMLESGKRMPTLIQAYQLAKMLGTTVEELFFSQTKLQSG